MVECADRRGTCPEWWSRVADDSCCWYERMRSVTDRMSAGLGRDGREDAMAAAEEPRDDRRWFRCRELLGVYLRTNRSDNGIREDPDARAERPLEGRDEVEAAPRRVERGVRLDVVLVLLLLVFGLLLSLMTWESGAPAPWSSLANEGERSLIVHENSEANEVESRLEPKNDAMLCLGLSSVRRFSQKTVE